MRIRSALAAALLVLALQAMPGPALAQQSTAAELPFGGVSFGSNPYCLLVGLTSSVSPVRSVYCAYLWPLVAPPGPWPALLASFGIAPVSSIATTSAAAFSASF